MKQPLIILTGPTAVGKTELSISLAKQVGGAVISADSMQVYRHMDIGSAKITKEEMQGIPHYLIDAFDPDEEFHVVRFQEYAKHCLEKIYGAGQIPILVGGTGFYIQALLYGIDFTEQAEDKEYRARLEQIAREQGPKALHKLLEETDELVFSTGVLPVGAELPAFKLDVDLDAGTYDAVCMVYLLDEAEDGTYIDYSSAGFHVTITVEN